MHTSGFVISDDMWFSILIKNTLDMQTGRVRDQATDPLINGRSALSFEPQSHTGLGDVVPRKMHRDFSPLVLKQLESATDYDLDDSGSVHILLF